MGERQYQAINQKSFYASMECVARGLDPMTTNPVVADPERSKNTICLLPLIIANEITYERRYDEAIEVWEYFRQEQFARDMMFLVQKNSLWDALRSYDLQTGTDALRRMDATVQNMARLAGDIVNASDKYVIQSTAKPRFATLEEIYDKLYDPAFQSFQAKQRPCRRYEGTYLEYIREQERKEIQKKSQNKDSRNRKMTEAFEIVFGIGDMDNTGYDAAWNDAMKSEELLKDFCDHLLQQRNMCFVTTKELETPGWKPPFHNGLIILNLAMHGDNQRGFGGLWNASGTGGTNRNNPNN